LDAALDLTLSAVHESEGMRQALLPCAMIAFNPDPR
jgi:hypothetical protein